MANQLNPQMLAAMLMQQGQQAPPVGGMQPNNMGAANAMNGGTDIMKAMMMQKLLGQNPQMQKPGAIPGQTAIDPSAQNLQMSNNA